MTHNPSTENATDWEIIPDDHMPWGVVRVAEYRHIRIRCEGEDMEHAKAVTRLVAAAPDLLRELKHLVRLLEPALNNGTASVPGIATVNGAWLAIAKAEGK